ncbi:MAG: hypothetical protein AB1758_13825 [Candidatus Eremiobacterota bacterium]
MRLRFALDDLASEPRMRTIEEVAEILGLTRAQAWMREATALRLLRRRTREQW